MEVTLNEIRDIVLNLQQILTNGSTELALFVRSTGSCNQASCNVNPAVEQQPEA
jgi:hypothetical protein